MEVEALAKELNEKCTLNFLDLDRKIEESNQNSFENKIGDGYVEQPRKRTREFEEDMDTSNKKFYHFENIKNYR